MPAVYGPPRHVHLDALQRPPRRPPYPCATFGTTVPDSSGHSDSRLLTFRAVAPSLLSLGTNFYWGPALPTQATCTYCAHHRCANVVRRTLSLCDAHTTSCCPTNDNNTATTSNLRSLRTTARPRRQPDPTTAPSTPEMILQHALSMLLAQDAMFSKYETP